VDRVSTEYYGSRNTPEEIETYRRRLELAEREERERIRRDSLLAQIPPRFLSGGAPKSIAYYQPRNATQVAAVAGIQKWIADVAEGKAAMLALIGPTGIGKSHLLYAAAWALFEQTKLVPLCLRWYTFADELRYGRGSRDERGNPKTPAHECRREWHAARCCLIDDVRPTSGTELDATELAKYALHAYDDNISVMLTTNAASLEDVMGSAPANRFRRIIVVGDSLRGL
jgi:DNA replication protein DnaC